MAMPTKLVVLFEGTGAANTNFDTGPVDTQDCDQVGYACVASAGITASSIVASGYLDAAGTKVVFSKTGTWSAGQNHAEAGIGPGSTHTSLGAPAVPTAVPPFVGVSASAAGVGVTVTVFIYGRRNHRGPDRSLNPD